MKKILYITNKLIWIGIPGNALTGFDDMEIAAAITPGLTTVHFPTAELGGYAAQHLIARLAGQPFEARVELPVELVVRGSSAPPPQSQ